MSANVRHSSATNEHHTPPAIVDRARAVLEAIDLDPFSCAEAQRTVRARSFGTLAEARSGGWNGFTGAWGPNGVSPSRAFCNPPGGVVDDAGFPIVAGCADSGACGVPPGHAHAGRWSGQKRAWQKLAREYAAGRVGAAVFVCFSLELLQTTQVEQAGPLPLDFPICYPSRRVAYLRADGSVGNSPPHASCVVYLPLRQQSGDGDAVGWRPSQEGVTAFTNEFRALGRVVVPW